MVRWGREVETKFPSNTYLEFVHLIDDPSKHRLACPICREDGRDTNGDHLSIGNGRVHCFADPEHGRTIWLSLRGRVNNHDTTPHIRYKSTGEFPVAQDNRPNPSLPSHVSAEDLPPAGDDDPYGAFFNTAYPEHQPGSQRVLDAESLRLETEVILCAVGGDLEEVNWEGLLRVLGDVRKELAKTVYKSFELQHLFGRILNVLKTRHEHGTWGIFLKKQRISQQSASRYMQLARVSWSEIEERGIRSANELIRLLKEERPAKPNKTVLQIASLQQEIDALKEDLERNKQPPGDAQLEARIRELERKNRVLVTRNTEKDMRIRTLERDRDEWKAKALAAEREQTRLA